MTTKSCWPLLYASVSEHIKHYRDDLEKHDLNSLEKNPEMPFLHWARDTGTCLEFLPPGDHPAYPPEGEMVSYLLGVAGRDHILDQKVEVARYWRDHGHGRVKAVYHFDGKELRQITIDRAIEIAEVYRRAITFEWTKARHRRGEFIGAQGKI